MSTQPRAPHILVVDDAPEILSLLHELLAEEDFRVSTSRAPLDRTQIKTIAPDVIVHDLLFAGSPEPGWQFLTMIRHDPDLAPMPLVLCTAATQIVSDPVIAARLDRLGVRVLDKPFDIGQFLAVLDEALARRPTIPAPPLDPGQAAP